MTECTKILYSGLATTHICYHALRKHSPDRELPKYCIFLNLLDPLSIRRSKNFSGYFPSCTIPFMEPAISKRSGACQSLAYLKAASNACVLPWIVIPVLPHVFVIVFVFPIFTTTSMHFPKLRHCPTIASKTRNMNMHSMSQGRHKQWFFFSFSQKTEIIPLPFF